MVARVQTTGVTTRSKNRFGGEPSSKRALQLESPPLHARIYEKLYGHFPPRYPPFRPRKTMEERESFSSLFLPPSFIVCHGYRVHYWLFILVEGRERGRLIQVEALGEIEPADQILWQANTWKFCRGVFHPRFGYFPPTIPAGILSSNDFNEAIQLILRKLTFRLKKISRFNYRPAFRTAI